MKTILPFSLSLAILLTSIPSASPAQWELTNGPCGGYINCLAVSGTDLIAATSGGVWRRPVSELVSMESASEGLPTEFILDQNYPNPFNPSTTIRYALPTRSRVILSVLNMLGQQVASLVNETEDPGYHDVKFDASDLASGMYFYRLQAGTYVETKKLLLLLTICCSNVSLANHQAFLLPS